MRRALVWLGLSLVSGVAPAAAQTFTVTPFVEAGPVLTHDGTWGSPAIVAASAAGGGGVRIGPHAEVRVTVDLTPATDVVTAPASYYEGNPPVETSRVTYLIRARDRSVSVMFGWPLRAGSRLDITPSIGLARIHRVDSVTAATVMLSTGERVEREVPESGRHCCDAPAFGLAAVARLTAHLSLVPEIRAIWYSPADNAGVILRSGMGVRYIW